MLPPSIASLQFFLEGQLNGTIFSINLQKINFCRQQWSIDHSLSWSHSPCKRGTYLFRCRLYLGINSYYTGELSSPTGRNNITKHISVKLPRGFQLGFSMEWVLRFCTVLTAFIRDQNRLYFTVFPLFCVVASYPKQTQAPTGQDSQWVYQFNCRTVLISMEILIYYSLYVLVIIRIEKQTITAFEAFILRNNTF